VPSGGSVQAREMISFFECKVKVKIIKPLGINSGLRGHNASVHSALRTPACLDWKPNPLIRGGSGDDSYGMKIILPALLLQSTIRFSTVAAAMRNHWGSIIIMNLSRKYGIT
jgi:hypothetical protein